MKGGYWTFLNRGPIYALRGSLQVLREPREQPRKAIRIANSNGSGLK